jgi:hypothetical protein
MKKPDPKIVAYLSCSAGRMHFARTNLNDGCGTSLGNLVEVYHHIVSNFFWALCMDLQPEKDYCQAQHQFQLS